jgi:transposase
VKASDLIRLVINKEIVPEQVGRGRRGYGNLARTRLVIYQRLMGYNDSQLIRHLEANSGVCWNIGLRNVPDRSQISRWKKQYANIQEYLFSRLSAMAQDLVKTDILAVDSTPLVDEGGKCGYNSRGPFVGFKLHLAVNQLGLPLKAIFGYGNENDSPYLPKLLVGANVVLADKGYCAESNRQACRDNGSTPMIAFNKRREKAKYWQPPILFRKRYIIEQFNAIVKGAMNKCWQKVKGFTRKKAVVFASLNALLVVSIESLLMGRCDIRSYGRYRC